MNEFKWRCDRPATFLPGGVCGARLADVSPNFMLAAGVISIKCHRCGHVNAKTFEPVKVITVSNGGNVALIDV